MQTSQQEFKHKIQRIPDSPYVLEYEYDDEGRLLRLSGGGRCYLRTDSTKRVYDEGFAEFEEIFASGALLRRVTVGARSWTELYRWNNQAQPTEVDGVTITRDEQGRVTECRGRGQHWRYEYTDDLLTKIEGPSVGRHLRYDGLQRLSAMVLNGKQEGISYDGEGRRKIAAAAPATWHRDDEGRVWAVSDENGRIVSTYLWDEFACLARIDGAPGGPMAEVYSLDLGGTPVRVTTAHASTIIPRDLFGENLTLHDGVPGLFGGAQHEGLVYYAYRSYDPRFGVFNSPDPLDGGADDPRRDDGYAGALVAERTTAGGYGVCGYDTFTYSDPTGAIAWYYLLSSLTWAFPNNWFLTLGMDWTLNFWGSLFSGNIGRFFNFRHIHSERLNVGGILRDGAMATTRAFATQHYIWEQFASFDQAKNVMVCSPNDRFAPTFYGSTLRMVETSSGRAFMLRGMSQFAYDGDLNGDYPDSWTRHGGTAEAIAPGMLTPYFPQGGLHLGDMFTEATFCTATQVPQVQGPTDATLTELETMDRFGVGTVNNLSVVTVLQTGLGLTANQNIGLADAETPALTSAAFVTQVQSAVERGILTIIRLNPAPTGLNTADIRLRGLQATTTSEAMGDVGDLRKLNADGTTGNYEVGDFIHMTQGPDDRGFGIIVALEAQVALDAAFSGTPGPNPGASILPAVAGGPVNGVDLTATGTELNFTNAPRPGVGDMIRVFSGGTDIPVVVTAANGNMRTIDRGVGALGTSGSVSWQALAPGGAIGTTTTFDAGAQITFTTAAVRTAPSTGYLAHRTRANAVQVRRVTALNYDGIVIGSDKTGAAANYTVELFKTTNPSVDNLILGTAAVLALNAPMSTDGVTALQVHQLNADNLAANLQGASATGLALNANVLSRAVNNVAGSNELRPTQPVGLDDGTNQEIGLIRIVERNVLFDRDLPIAAGDLRAVRVQTVGVNYNATRISNTQLVVLPTDAGTSTRLEMTRFFVGELVEIRYTDGGTVTDQMRVAAVDGMLLTLELGRANLPGTGSNFQVQRLDVQDPATGGVYIAIDGSPQLANQGGNTTRVLRFRLWNWTDLAGTERVGIISGDRTIPARVGNTLYDCTQPGADPEELLVAATVGGTTVDQPVFATGERVEASWDPGGGAVQDEFTITAVTGSTVKLTHDTTPGTITAGSNNITIRRLTVVRLTLANNPASVSGTVNVRQLDHTNNNAWAPTFTTENDQTIILDPAVTGTLTASNNQTIVIPLRESAVRTEAVMHPGGVLVPEDPETWEHNRYQALVEHELRHTEQYLWWGPLWFTAFPLWAFDLGFSYAGVDLPEWSAFVAGTIERDASNNNIRLLRIPNRQGIDFKDNSHLQIYRGSVKETAQFDEKRADDLFRIKAKASGETSLSDGAVFVRKCNSALGPTGQAWYSAIYQIFDTLTPGGLLNIIFGLGYGTLMLLIVRIPWMIAKACSTYTRFAATVLPSRNELQLNEAGRRSEFANESRVIIRQSGKDDFVRSLRSVDETGKLTLGSSLGFEGNAEVSPYDTSVDSQYWYWQKYYPAIVKPNSFAVITAQTEDGKKLEASSFDRLHIIGEKSSNHERFTMTTTVTSVSGDDIELADGLPTDALGASDQVLRVAKVGRQDAQGHVESFFLDQYGLMGPMRWVSDPFRQLHLRNIEKPGSAWEIISRIARYIWGTHNWSLGIPGHVFIDRLFPGDDIAYLADIEQDSSNQSGDLYSALGRMRGSVEVGDGFNAEMVVGDIARYWYWPNPRTVSFPTQNGWCNTTFNQDRPGVNTRQAVCLMPFVTNETGGAAPGNGAEPNNNAEAGAAGTNPGLAVADVFYAKNAAAPADVPGPAAGTPRRIMPANRGWIPTSKTLSRTQGMYVAFTTPTTGANRHRVTTDNAILSADEARHAQDEGKQKILYNVNVTDVTITLNGIAVTEGMTINLLRTQRARFVCLPNNNRRYRVTVLRPTDGTVVRRSDELEVEMRTAAAGSSEPVEISRFYRFDTGSNRFETGGLMQHGMHLPTDIDVAVRRITINTVDAPIVLNSLAAAIDFSSYASPIPNLTPGGEVFVFIAANVLNFNPQIAYPGTPGTIHPVLIQQDQTGSAPEATRNFLGAGGDLGGVFRLSIAAEDPPEEQAQVTVDVQVGATGNTTNLTQIVIPITGHFLATSGSYTAAAGGSITLDCANVGGGGVTPDPASVVVQMPDGTTPPEVSPGTPELTFAAGGANQLVVSVDAGFSNPGTRRLLIRESGNASNVARRTITLT